MILLIVSPVKSGNFVQGLWSGPVTITNTFENNQLTVRRTGGSETGQSNNFDVISSSVDHFEFSIVNSPQEAGVPFNITITAKDAANNTVVDFSGTGELSDKTVTIIPKETGSFTNGQWSGAVTITKSIVGNSITVTSSGKASTSNTFDVNHAELDHFRFSTIGTPQIAGSPFLVSITAEDVYNNKVTSYESFVTLTEKTGTITPNTTTNFVNGFWSDQITISKSENDVQLQASSSGKNGSSNYFNVVAGALNNFSIASLSTQAAGEPFPLKLTALDNNGNVVTSFSGTVDTVSYTHLTLPTN